MSLVAGLWPTDVAHGEGSFDMLLVAELLPRLSDSALEFSASRLLVTCWGLKLPSERTRSRRTPLESSDTSQVLDG